MRVRTAIAFDEVDPGEVLASLDVVVVIEGSDPHVAIERADAGVAEGPGEAVEDADEVTGWTRTDWTTDRIKRH